MMKKHPESIEKEGGKVIPALCNVLGTVILISIIFVCIPVTVPRFFGYGIYQVLSGSLEPEIPTGSAVYVKAVPHGEIEELIFQTCNIIIFEQLSCFLCFRKFFDGFGKNIAIMIFLIIGFYFHYQNIFSCWQVSDWHQRAVQG